MSNDSLNPILFGLRNTWDHVGGLLHFQPYFHIGGALHMSTNGRLVPASSDWVADHAKETPAPALVIHSGSP